MALKKFTYALRRYRRLGGSLPMWYFYRYHIKQRWSIEQLIAEEKPQITTPLPSADSTMHLLTDINSLPKDKFDFCKSLLEIITNVVSNHHKSRGVSINA
jgi:hypothetical protein